MNTNYWSGKVACEILFPILKPGARVVNVSSAAGFPGNLRSHNGNQVIFKILFLNGRYAVLETLDWFIH